MSIKELSESYSGSNSDEEMEEAVEDNNDRYITEEEMQRLIKEHSKRKDNQDDNEIINNSEFNTIHSINFQNLIEHITRNKIFNSKYYKEQCFGLNSATLIDKAIELDCVGGTFGGFRKPTNFLCLLMKMLQIQIELEIIFEYIHNNYGFKYLTALGAIYLRLVGSAKDIYEQLEPLYKDFRKLRYLNIDGSYKIIHLDEFIDQLLNNESCCDIKLPFLTKRIILEKNNILDLYHSPLEDKRRILNINEPINNEKNSVNDKNGFKLKLKKKSQKEEKEQVKESISIEETNELRKQLGLKPLK
ncbi:hypothetical protein ABK040_009889 [Willaertia magna]